jgi:hypothetical protein
MRRAGLDPQNPCDASGYVGRKLSATARKMGDDPSNPYEMPAGSEGRQERAREYWAKVIAASGLFTALGTAPETAPEEECSVPRPDDPDKPWSISFKVIFIWSCAGARSAEPHLVTGSRYADGSVEFEVEPDRSAAIKVLVDEALAVSYAAGGWETRRCDDGADGRQGVFPMTRQEAAAARVTDRCDVDANIAGAARLVLGDEAVQPRSRAAGLGPFQPMAGGWQRLSVAMGDDLGLFSKVGPSRNYTGTEACTTVMTAYLRAIAPHAAEFAALREVPTASELRRAWDPKLTALRGAHGVTAPESDPACAVGSWARGFNAALAEHATELAGADPAGGPNLIGLGNYYQGKEDAIRPIEPVPGKDTLVIPRLAVRPLEDVGAPIAPDATEAWSRAGTGEGVSLPVAQRAVDFAWFFGGVIEPFDSAGERIGSLLNDDPEGSGPNDDPEGSGPNDDPEGSGPNDDPEGSGPKDDPEGSGKPAPKQTEVGPDGCPTKAPPNTLRQGAAKIGIAKLCADAVAKARTPEAAKAIKWALSQGLGLKYSMPRRNEPGFADCSSFVSRAYRDAIPGLYTGNAPTTHTLRGLSWTRKIPLGRAKPGDLVEPHPGHVAMQLAGGYKVHTNRTGDVAHVTRGYSSATWVGWVDPAKV